MFRNLSDKEIRESTCKNHDSIDYFRQPQKTFFLISMIGLILSTFAELSISLYLYYSFIKSEQKRYDLFIEVKKSELGFYYYKIPYAYECNENTSCEELEHNFYNDKNCTIFNNCSKFNTEFSYYGNCNYLFDYDYIYKCIKENKFDYYHSHYCYRIDKCSEIDKYKDKTLCNNLDECYKNYSDFYYLGYCEYSHNLIYKCTKMLRYYDFDIANFFYKCNEIANCSEIDNFPKDNVCPYWGNCYNYSQDFYYSGYCDIDYQDHIYNCYQKENFYDEALFDNQILIMIIIVIGCLQLLIVIILVIVAMFLKGNLFKKMLETPFIRYLILFSPFLIYSICIAIEIILVINFHHYKHNHKLEMIFTIISCIIQSISLIILMLGVIFVNINKSDLEILESYNDLRKPLVPNNFS